MKGRSGGQAADASWAAALHRAQPVNRRLLLEAFDLTEIVETEDPHLRCLASGTGWAAIVMSAPTLDVRVDQLAEVHAIQVVAGEDQVVLGVVAREMSRALADRVGCALEPLRAIRRLLRGQHLDEAARKHVEPVGLGDVTVERRGIELGEHEDPLQVGVQTIADGHVDQPVLAADRYRRLRPHVRQRKETLSTSASQNQGQHVVHAGEC